MKGEKSARGTRSSFTDVERFVSETATEAELAMLRYRDTAFHRFPLLFSILALFGTVVTVFGLEHVMEEVEFFADHALLTLFLGLATLACTGALYKHLS